jgi:hypothetical protein
LGRKYGRAKYGGSTYDLEKGINEPWVPIPPYPPVDIWLPVVAPPPSEMWNPSTVFECGAKEIWEPDTVFECDAEETWDPLTQSGCPSTKVEIWTPVVTPVIGNG